MQINTRYFGKIDMPEEKFIHFENGIPGFKDFKDYVLLYDLDDESHFFSWLQSINEETLSFPVVKPVTITNDYNPTVNSGLLETIGNPLDEDMIVLLLATVPNGKPEETTVNMKAPIIINAKTKQGMQVVIENEEYQVKFRLINKENGQEG